MTTLSENRGLKNRRSSAGTAHARPSARRERVLVVEDEPDMARLIAFNIKRAGFQVETAASAVEALEWLAGNVADLLIVDVMLPVMDGFEFCRRIRETESLGATPVLMLTARGEFNDRVRGLESGADDYVIKPFHPRELLLRIEALLRRRVQENDSVLEIGPVRLDSRSMRAELNGELLQLTRTEFRLLWVLVERRGQVQSREVWGYERFFDTRTVDTHLRRLRAKLGDFAGRLTTVRGEGYAFSVE